MENARFKKMHVLVVTFLMLLWVFASLFTSRTLALEKINLNLVYDGQDHYYSNYKINISLNGNILPYSPDVPPVILENRTYVPVRQVFESLGATVDYNEEKRQVYIAYGSVLIMLQIDSKDLHIDGNILKMDVAPKIVNDRTLIPLSFAAQALNFKVDWEDATKTVAIQTPQNQNESDIGPLITETVPPSATPAPVESLPPLILSGENDGTGIDTGGQSDYGNLNTNTPAGKITGELSIDMTKNPLTAENHPEAQITSLKLPADSHDNSFTITADSPLTSIERFVLNDNRLVVDLYNSLLKLPKTSYDANKSYLSAIRAGQNIINGQNVTRLVFDLTSPVGFSVSLSPDRKSVTVTFEKNSIVNINFRTDGTSDYVEIEGITRPITTLFPLSNPDRLVIDLPLSSMAAQVSNGVSGVFSNAVRSSQFDQNTGRVVVDLKKQAAYHVTSSGNTCVITLSQPTFKNIYYDGANRRIVLAKPAVSPFLPESVYHSDQYTQLRYQLSFPGNYADFYGYGEYMIKDGMINSILLQTTGGSTSLVINENSILAYTVTEDASHYYINVLLPREKYNKIVYIDPGHGGSDPGASGIKGLVEKDLALDTAKKLVSLLEQDARIKVYASRLEDVYPTLTERAEQANQIADLFVSVHYNKFNKTANGTEVYYRVHDNDAAIGFTSKQMADIFQKNLISQLGSFDRKVKTNEYVVLKRTKIPAILVEVGFIDQEEEATKIATSEYRQLAAEAMYRSILEVFQLYDPAR